MLIGEVMIMMGISVQVMIMMGNSILIFLLSSLMALVYIIIMHRDLQGVPKKCTQDFYGKNEVNVY